MWWRGARALALCSILLPVYLIAACHHPGPTVTEIMGTTMGTTYSVKVVGLPGSLPPVSLQTAINGRLEQIEQIMSTYRPDSELSRFSASRDTQWRSASPELAQVIGTALEIGARSSGAFDVSVGPLVNLWGFGPPMRNDEPPEAQKIHEALNSVGYRHLHVRENPPAIRKDLPELYVDLSGIAKGYGVDAIVRLLEQRGLKNFLVEIGGEVRGRGHNGRGEPWRIGIERPEEKRRTAYAVIPLQDMAVATSGDYRNFYESEGRRYSHTIDPRSGRPVTHDLASVTVVHPSATRADAWATALMVLGAKAGADLARREGLAALFIARTPAGGFSLQETPAFSQLLRPEASESPT